MLTAAQKITGTHAVSLSDSHEYNPRNKSSKGVKAQRISPTVSRWDLSSHTTSFLFSQFGTFHIYPGQHIKAPAHILFPWSRTGRNTLWWSYLTSPGWPTCMRGSMKMSPGEESICRYRVFVDVLAVRENELRLGRTAGDQQAAAQLILDVNVVSIGAAQHPPLTCGRQRMQR